MAKYRKKPIIIEAEQFITDKNWVEGVIEAPCPCTVDAHNYWIETLEGHHHVSDGDWIITGINGERYPCKPDIFNKTYEKVD